MNTGQEHFQLDLQVVFNAIELAAMARHEKNDIDDSVD
jgi:hypothetical protein